METVENNKLIAAFMGLESTNDFYDGMALINARIPFNLGTMGNGTSTLRFRSSWDWLMPVVEKIESLGYGVTIGMGMYAVIQDDVTEDDIEFTGMEEGKLASTYKVVVEFIEWFNNKKQ